MTNTAVVKEAKAYEEVQKKLNTDISIVEIYKASKVVKKTEQKESMY